MQVPTELFDRRFFHRHALHLSTGCADQVHRPKEPKCHLHKPVFCDDQLPAGRAYAAWPLLLL